MPSARAWRPRDAYVFAKGNEVTASSGQPAKLRRPLDFLVVADHSDAMGFFPLILAGTPEIMADPQGKKWHDMITAGQGNAAALDIIGNFSNGTISKAILPLPGTPAYISAWQDTIKAAEEANDPGRFTAFIGFEWTSNTGGNNLHRNVIFRDDGDKAGKVEPYTTMKPLGSDNPVDLWKWMDAYQQSTGGRVLAIAHNGNLSNGLMFPTVEAFGKKLDAEYATTREKWERLYETTQTKGTGESHPYLSPNDEFADFEIWDKGNLDGSVAKTQDMLEFEYTRSGPEERLAAGTGTRHQSLQVRPGRQQRCAHRNGRDGRGQFLRQDHAAGTEPGTPDQGLHEQPEVRRQDHGLGSRRLRLCRGLGDREHPCRPVGRDGAQGDLRHHGSADDRAFLRRLRLRGQRCRRQHGRQDRLRQGRADGRRPGARRPQARRRPSSSPR